MREWLRPIGIGLLLLVLILPGAPLAQGGPRPAGESSAPFSAPRATGWVKETVDAAGVTGLYSSLAVDSSGAPHISYLDSTDSELMYAHYVGTDGNCGPEDSWQCDPLSIQHWTAFTDTAIALDSNDDPHVAYCQGTVSGPALGYAHYVGGGGNCGPGASWQCDLITAGCKSVSLALDSIGDPHISYETASLNYAHLVDPNSRAGCSMATSWDCVTVDAWSGGSAIALDSSNTPHISYHGPGNWLWLAAFVGLGDGNCGPTNSWQCDVLDDSGVVGQWSSLAFDSGDSPHISYYDLANGALRYAHHVGAGAGNCGPATDWQCDTVDGAGDTGQYSSLALDSGDIPHIGYYRADNGNLKYASLVGTGGNCGPGDAWQCDGVQFGGDAGLYSSLALDADGYPHIGYHEAGGKGDLRYAWWCLEPGVSMGHSPEPACQDSPVGFSAIVSGSPRHHFSWDFGDGATSHEENPQHTYNTAGVFLATVQVTNSCGGDYDMEPVTVYGFPTAAFLHDGVPGCVDAAVHFTSTSVASGTLSHLWDFGDGASSEDAHPDHAFAAAGLYTVTLTATNPCQSDAVSDAVEVIAPPAGASFSWQPALPDPGEVVTFTASAQGAQKTFSWAFGDGSAPQQGPSVQHTFAATSTYTVRLTATNPCGESAAAESVDVRYCRGPVGVGLIYAPDPLLSGRPAVFTATLAGGDEPVQFSWLFGDGTEPQQGRSVEHTYDQPGPYNLTLGCSNACGSLCQFFPLQVHEGRSLVYLPLLYKDGFFDPYEPDDTPAQANSLSVEGLQRHSFHPQDDVDWLTLDLAAGATYRIETGELAGGADTVLTLYAEGQYGSYLATNDDCTPTVLYSCLSFEPGVSGRYYLEVVNYPGGAVWGRGVRYTIGVTLQGTRWGGQRR